MAAKQDKVVNYVALGDSYTIGTGAGVKEAWPVILADHLNREGVRTKLIANPARNGFSSQDVIDYELPVFDKSNATFVTLLIGVNDWVRETDSKTFHDNLKFIIEHIQKKLPEKNKLLLITIPDFGVTPQGKIYGKGRNISEGISRFNEIIKGEAKSHGLNYVDIFEISKQMSFQPELVAEDGLHPSAKEYKLWEELIFPEAKKLLSE